MELSATPVNRGRADRTSTKLDTVILNLKHGGAVAGRLVDREAFSPGKTVHGSEIVESIGKQFKGLLQGTATPTGKYFDKLGLAGQIDEDWDNLMANPEQPVTLDTMDLQSGPVEVPLRLFSEHMGIRAEESNKFVCLSLSVKRAKDSKNRVWQTNESGIEICAKFKDNRSTELARMIQETLKAMNIKTVLTRPEPDTDEYVGIKLVPTVTLSVGYIDNKADCNLMQSTPFKRRIATALHSAILQFKQAEIKANGWYGGRSKTKNAVIKCDYTKGSRPECSTACPFYKAGMCTKNRNVPVMAGEACAPKLETMLNKSVSIIAARIPELAENSITVSRIFKMLTK